MARRAAGRKAKDGSYQPLASIAPSTQAPLAAICLVFEADDDDGIYGKQSMTQKIRQPLVDKLRAADLFVHETIVKSRKQCFVKVSASEKRLRQVADLMKLKLRLIIKDVASGHLEKQEGAWAPFQQHLASLYEHSTEGGLFSSNQQLQILEYILSDEDPRALGPQLVHADERDLGNSPLDQLQKNGQIQCFFRMHNPSKRDDLMRRWALNWKAKQPIEEIREYFGEKIALYFVWLGFYTEMLWIPALCGTCLTISQLISYHLTGSMDNPWVPLYCCFMSVWTIVLSVNWKRLEKSYQYEWDTLEFEDTETDRKEFISNANTHLRLIEYKGEYERYADPFYRRAALAISAAVVLASVIAVVVVVTAIALMRFKLLKVLEPVGMAWFAKAVGGVSQAVSIMVFNRLYQTYLLQRLTDMENWQTDTQYEDATIAKDFSFKIINAYFACFFVAFVQNNIKVYGEDMHCPLWNCMSELTATLATIFIVQLTVQQAGELGQPVMKQYLNKFKSGGRLDLAAIVTGAGGAPAPAVDVEAGGVGGAAGAGAAGAGGEEGMVVDMSAAEEEVMSEEVSQSLLTDYPGVIEDYTELMIQLGYVNLFAAAFPFTAALALMNNLVEIRVDAYKLLALTRRPLHCCAQDIGTWQDIMDMLATCSIMTNCALVGFVSHGLYFYFPEMTPTERVWITIICEHALLLFKAVLEAVLHEPPDEPRRAYERRTFMRDKLLSEVEFLQPHDKERPFYTSDEGEPYYGSKHHS